MEWENKSSLFPPAMDLVNCHGYPFFIPSIAAINHQSSLGMDVEDDDADNIGLLSGREQHRHRGGQRGVMRQRWLCR